jgi:hypothetical protein
LSAVTKTRSYSDGGTISADNYNDDRDEVIAGVNSINNAQIADDAAIVYSKLNLGGNIKNADITGAAAIAESKLAFNTSTGHSHNGTDSKKITVNRAFTWFLDGTSINGVAGATYIAPQAMTVVKVQGKLTSGTCTITLKKGTTTIDTMNVTSTLGTDTSITSAAITAGDLITLTISSASSPVGLIATMECEQ